MNAASSSAATPTIATTRWPGVNDMKVVRSAGERAVEVLLHPIGIRMISLKASMARLRTATVS